MRNPIGVLKSLTEQSKDETYKFQRLYRNLYNPEFYYLAYKNIYANKGSMTIGVDGTNMDGMSDGRIEKLITSLKDHSYRPNPARREYISKKNSKKKRPLGIPSSNDKLVQEVVRMILESIFESNFKPTSHGFRPKRSCHTALKQIHDTFTGAKWFVEGDIKACFDSFDHQIVITLLKKRIEDEAFIQLVWKLLKAGYMEQWQYFKTYDGVPQGSGVSPILANIYLNELDKYMEEYKSAYCVGTHKDRLDNPAYTKLTKKTSYFKRTGDKMWDALTETEKVERTKVLQQMRRDVRQLTPTLPCNPNYKSLQYVRYADDFLIGVIGSKEDAEQIKADVKRFLAEKLKLTLSDEKTKVTHTGERARFLGYDITVSRSQDLSKTAKGITQRCQSYVVKLLVPREKWVSKLLEYKAIKIVRNKNGKERYKTLHRGKLINKEDIAILSAYNSEIRGLRNFYALANDSFKIGIFANIMKYSMYKTFANKYKTNVNQIKRRYCKDGLFTIPYQTKGGSKQAVFYNGGFKRELLATTFADVSLLPPYKSYDKKNELRTRLKLGLCELCGTKTTEIELHQVKKLKDLNGRYEWERVMRSKRRRTLAVCPACHAEIHSKTIQRP